MKYFAATALILFGLAACSGPGAVSPRKALMYEVPETPTLTYVSEASQDVIVDAGAMGTMEIQGSSDITMAMTFASAENGMEVTVEFQELTASLNNPMGAPETASESDIEGPLVFTMDGMGRGTVVSTPEVKGSAEQLVRPAGLAYEFFPRLPGDVTEPGAMWTDTTAYELPAEGGMIASESITTYTLVGDTAVDGVTLLKITYEGEAEAVAEAVTQGMEVIQSFSGDVVGMFLFDPARGVMVYNESSQDLDGTTEVPAAGIPPMPMSVTGTSTVWLQGG
ncbi:MAG: hypothetical protein HKO65_07250 [Gemmatimonadetes bacterium]|nr:hypothetical protein [Gemmatimonadota bacterium]NNM04884.1 hypothetical protein [Gemmatimonadota bacterium]